MPAEEGRLPGPHRAGTLTPYALETIAEDVLRAGPGARLELTLPVGTSAAEVARVNGGAARLRARGLHVEVVRAASGLDSARGVG